MAVHTTMSYWGMTCLSYIVFQLYAFYVTFKLRRTLVIKNHVVISIFSIVLLSKLVLISLLFWDYTEQGNMILTISESEKLSIELFIMYMFRFVNTFMDFLLYLVFYSIVFNMINVWDLLYYENVFYQIGD